MEPVAGIILDSTRDHAEILKKNIENRNRHIQLTICESLEQLLQTYFNSPKNEIIISEFLFKDCTGIDFLQVLRQRNIDIPVIFVTQDAREESAVEAFRNGASDFFIKDIGFAHFDKLINSIIRTCAQYRSNLAKKKAEQELKTGYDQFLKIFNSIDEIIFISSLEDYRIIFANRYFKQKFSEPIIGRTCYQVFYNSQQICQNCTNKKLLHSTDKEPVVKRIVYLEKTRSWYNCTGKLITWTDGQRVKVDLMIDITDLKKKTQELNNRLKYEKVLSEISSKAMMIKNLDDFLNEGLEIMGKATGVSRVYIFQNYESNTRCKNTHEWVDEGTIPFIGLDADYKDFPYWYTTLSGDHVIMAEDIYDLPQEVHYILSMQNIKSILVVPIFVRGEFFGFIGFDECNSHRQWQEYEINLLRAAAQIIGAKISYEKEL
ncbi:MAG: response regulator [Spirochaetota bacterium]